MQRMRLSGQAKAPIDIFLDRDDEVLVRGGDSRYSNARGAALPITNAALTDRWMFYCVVHRDGKTEAWVNELLWENGDVGKWERAAMPSFDSA